MKKTRILTWLLLMSVNLTACSSPDTRQTSQVPAQDSAQAGETTAAETQTAERYSSPEITIVMADINNENSENGKATNMFAELVDERSAGRIKIEPYFSGQLGSEAENIENLRSGMVGITKINVANLQNRGIDIPEYSLLGLPYLIRNQEHAQKYLESDVAKDISARIAEVTNGEIISLNSYIIASPRHFFAKTPATCMADMAGMKVRSETTELKIDTMTAFGMSATPMGLNDVYSALQTGMIDGGEHNLANIKSYAFYEQSPNILMTAHTYNINICLVSGVIWSSLSEADQELIQTAMEESCNWCVKEFKIEDENLRKELEGQGVTFTEPADIEKWHQAAEVLYEKYGTGYENFIEEVLSYAE